MTQWYYMDGKQSRGPVSQNTLLGMVRDGMLNEDTLICAHDSEKWHHIKEVFELDHDNPLPSLPAPELSTTHLPEKAESWSDSPPHPWRRYFARILDIYVNGTIVISLLAMLLTIIDGSAGNEMLNALQQPEMRLLSVMFTIFCSTFLTAAFISLTGTSLGKYIFGIKVTDNTSRLVTYQVAWQRELAIWVQGLGLSIPIVVLFTLLFAYRRLDKTGTTLWDQRFDLQVHYQPNKGQQIVMNIIGVSIIIGLAILNMPDRPPI